MKRRRVIGRRSLPSADPLLVAGMLLFSACEDFTPGAFAFDGGDASLAEDAQAITDGPSLDTNACNQCLQQGACASVMQPCNQNQKCSADMACYV
jgi:hypothetical protein